MERLICRSNISSCRYQGNKVFTDKGEFFRCNSDLPCTGAEKLPESVDLKLPDKKERIERVKTIRNLVDIAILVDRIAGEDRERLLPTILETIYEQAQANVEEFCVVVSGCAELCASPKKDAK